MGNSLTPPRIPGSDLTIFHPPPWPGEHTSSDGFVLPYKENGRFQNTWMAGRPSVASFFLDSFRGPDESNIPGKDQISETLKNKPPVWQNDSNFSASSCRLTWLGHATVLAEVDGCTILADPVFSDRASFVQFAGPRRYTDPGCTVEDLPKVDAVIISHNHYDHLDRDSVTKLTELQPNISWFVPEGTAQWLIDNTTIGDANKIILYSGGSLFITIRLCSKHVFEIKQIYDPRFINTLKFVI